MTTEELQKLLNVATPGPWVKCDYDTLNDEIIIENHEGEYVGSIDCDGAYEGKIAKRIEANARLIASATDLARKVIAAEKLVEALRHLSGTYDCSDVTGPALAAWEAAQ